MSLLRIVRAIALALLPPMSAMAAPTVIDFEDLPGMTFFVGNPVPVESQLSDQYLDTLGVRFSSGNPYVAVVAMGIGHATSGANGLAGTDGNGLNTGTVPIDAAFYDPADPSNKAVTDFVSIRGDLWGGGGPISLIAYDLDGNEIASDTEPDSGGQLLSVTAPGIHSVRYINNGSTGIDDFTFNPLTVTRVSEPGTLAIVGLALSAIAARRNRRGRQAC